MTAWSEWALEKHERKVKCQQFKEKRIKTLVSQNFLKFCFIFKRQWEYKKTLCFMGKLLLLLNVNYKQLFTTAVCWCQVRS